MPIHHDNPTDLPINKTEQDKTPQPLSQDEKEQEAINPGMPQEPSSSKAPTESTADKATDLSWLPESCCIKDDQGNVDILSSAKQLASDLKKLSQPLNTASNLPATPDDYNPTGLPEGITLDQLKKDQAYRDFLQNAHQCSLSNEQVSFVLKEYFARQSQQKDHDGALAQQSAEKDLRQGWATDTAFQQHMTWAKQAFETFAHGQDKVRISEIGNNPVMLRLLANIGQSLSEDLGVNNPAADHNASTDVATAMHSEAYWNSQHPDHQQVMTRVKNFYSHNFN